MKKTELVNCPQWLLDASTEDEDVTIDGSIVTWHDGTWNGGIWRGGVWHGGTWYGGAWNGGGWHGGTWNGGVWHGGTVMEVSVKMIGTFTFCDSHHKTLFAVDGVAWILAGRRWFTLAHAKKHWAGREDRVFTRASLHSAVALAKHFGLKEE